MPLHPAIVDLQDPALRSVCRGRAADAEPRTPFGNEGGEGLFPGGIRGEVFGRVSWGEDSVLEVISSLNYRADFILCGDILDVGVSVEEPETVYLCEDLVIFPFPQLGD